MNKNRLEAFTDGVIAIIITIMVIEMRIPHGQRMLALVPILPVFLSYILSFIYVGIYWNNHHNMLHASGNINGAVLWANLHLLFWLSLFPFVTGWMGENRLAQSPTELYGAVLLMASVAYLILQHTIIAAGAPVLQRALGKDWKGKASPLLYIFGILGTQWSPAFAKAVYAAVALLWLVPDRRIEKTLIRGKD